MKKSVAVVSTNSELRSTEVENDKLATTQGTAMDRPSYIPKDTRGTEHIGREDLQMPRMGLAQKMSPQIEDGNVAYIPDLKEGMFFNDLTNEVYGKGPFKFMVIRADPPRWVEFIPREEGGGIRDFSVPRNDPRTKWGATGDKPTATQFYDFILLLMPTREMIAISFKSTGIKVAKQLNGLMRFRSGPCFCGVYELSSALKQNAKGKFAVPQVRNAGWPTEEDLKFAEEAYEAIKDRAIVLDRDHDREPGSDDMDGEGGVDETEM